MKEIGEYNKENVSSREYKYDNIKFVLIFLVVFGHIIENIEKLNIMYLIIYSFHMPVFVFVSGYFAKGNKKSIIKPISIYIIFQTLYFVIYKLILRENITLNYLQPIWIVWYIFAVAVWNVLIFIVRKSNINTDKYSYEIMAFTFLISLLCGYINNIGYFLSLSRIITFFPFFMLGYFSKNNNINIIQKNGKTKYFIYLVIIIICILYFTNIPNIDRIWFYGSYSYLKGGYNIIFRIFSSILSLCVIFFINNLVSNKKISIISFIGKNTLFIYLLHGIIVKIFNSYIKVFLDSNNTIVSIIIAIIFTVAIIVSIEIIVIFIKKLIEKILYIAKNRVKTNET